MPNSLEARSRCQSLIAVFCGICLGGVVAGCTKTAADLPKLATMKGAVLDIFDSPPLSKSNPTAAATYQDGLNYFAKERYDRAIFYFQKVRDDFPFSPEAEKAELKIADAFYKNRDYSEAAEAYKNYLAFQPTTEHAAAIKYKLGLVYYDQFSRADRDQKNIKEAKRYFEILLKDHPNSEFVPDAKKKLAKAREYLAEREFLIGRFYLKEEKYLAARARFEDVLRDYMDTPTAVKALYRLGDAYRLEKDNVKATLAYQALIERYPDSAYADQARTYLATLKTEKQDPLASLLMQDGLPTTIETPQTQVATAAPGAGGGSLSGQEPALVTKEAYDHEEISNSNTSLLSSLNPFSSHGKDNKGKDNKGTGQQSEAGGEQATQGSEKGFFSSLNPFSSSSDKESAQKADNQGTGSESVVSSIDSSLEAKGVSGNTLPPAPESNLPKVPKKEEPPPTNPTELLSKVDKSLEQHGGQVAIPPTPELNKVFSKPLPPEPTEAEKLAAAKKAKAASETTTAGLLDNVDQALAKKGIQQPDVELPKEKPQTAAESVEGQQKQVELTPRLAKTTSTVELQPRLGSGGEESKPLMLNEGEATLSPPEEDETKSEKSAASKTKENDEKKTAARTLPKSVITGVPEKPAPVEAKATASKEDNWDAQKSPVDSMVDQVDQAAQVLNPLSW